MLVIITETTIFKNKAITYLVLTLALFGVETPNENGNSHRHVDRKHPSTLEYPNFHALSSRKKLRSVVL